MGSNPGDATNDSCDWSCGELPKWQRKRSSAVLKGFDPFAF
jgi:hypothetical protein